jgi:DNA-binding winged helix-turn-helix (wHTH) protein/TolB-like protein
VPGARHYRFEAFRLDTQARELRAEDGSAIPLTAKAYDTLVFLIEHRDRVVSKDELLEAVWPGRVVEENNLTQAVASLRRAFGTNAGEHRYIVTVSGRGYRFVSDVREEADAAPAPNIAPASNTAPANTAWRWRIASVALLVLSLIAIAAWRLREPPATHAAPQAALAVLPFRTLPAQPRDEMLELGLAETLIARISSSTRLRVRSIASSQRYAGEQPDPLEAGRALGATYVVEGSVQRLGDRVRVSARLLTVSDGTTVWSGSFDEKAASAFTLQDRIAAAMTSALSLKFNAPSARSPCDGANAEAYRAYLTGRYQLSRPSADRMHQAIAAFQQAIDLDPTCARAYAGMAYAYRALVMTGDADPRINFPLAKAAVRQALAIDPNLAEAYASQGFIQFWYDWDWAGAEASLKHAIALNPSLAEAHLAYAHLLANLGRVDESATQARQAIALDPLSPLINLLGSGFIAASGHPEESKRGVDKALALDPDYWIAMLLRSGTWMAQGDYPRAFAEMQRARDACGDCSVAMVAMGTAYLHAGDRPAAERVLHEMEERRRTGYFPATGLAEMRNALGDTQGALDLLETGFRERDVSMSFLQGGWDNLRSQPRFRALLARMNFAGDHALLDAPATQEKGIGEAR